MKNIIKKAFFVTALMTLMTVLFCFGASALAETGQCGDNVTYTYNSTTKELVISGTGAMKDYYYNGFECNSPFYNSDIKSVVIKSGVTTIGTSAFASCDSLTSVTIPDSVTTIGNSAFDSCDSLTRVTIPDSVTTIGTSAFASCDSLTSVTIPDSVTTIGNSAFDSCDSLTRVTIPDSVTTIGDWAFEDCDSLTSVTIPDSVTTIGYYAFSSCDSLTSITVDKNNKYYCNDSYGVLFNKNKTELIQYPIGNTRAEYIIPDSVTTIGDYAFYSCDSLTSVTIGNSVTTIGDSAFRYCDSLTSVTIGNSVTTIGDYAFASCDSLTSVTIPDSVTTIGDSAFRYCDSLTSVTIGNSVTTIGYYAFSSCDSLKYVYYHGTLEKWNKISIGSHNERLKNVNKYFHTPSYTVKTTVKATCTSDGVKTYTCSYSGCGATYTQAVAAIGHIWNTATYNFAADGKSCTATRVCANDTTHKETATATITSKVTTAATCEAKGKTTYTATFTKDWSKAQTKVVADVKALGHDYTGKITKEPTCTAKGVKTFTCQRDKSHTYTQAVAAKGHSWSSTGPACTVCNVEDTIVEIPKAYYSVTEYVAGDNWGENTLTLEVVFKNHSAKISFNVSQPSSVSMDAAGRYTVTYSYKSMTPEEKPVVTIYPAPTTTLKASSQTTKNVTLTWDAAVGANGYRIFYKSPTMTSWKQIRDVTTLTYKVSGLSAGTKYTFAVRPYYDTGSEKLLSRTYKTIKTATCTATPSISSITTPSKGKVTLGFSTVAGETGYTVYYSTSSSSGFKKYANYAANSKTGDVTGLTSGKTYYFKIRTYKTTDSGYVYSPWSAVKSIKVGGHSHSYKSAITTPATCTAKGVKTYTCSCGNTYTESIAAMGHSWSSSGPECTVCGGEDTVKSVTKAYYNITEYTAGDVWSSSATITFEVVYAKHSATVPFNAGVPKDLDMNKAGRYIVKATYKGVAPEELPVIVIYPKATTTLKASSQTNKTVTLTWDKATGANGYRLFYKSSSMTNWKQIKDVTTLTYKVSGLSAGTKYTFSVRPYYDTGAEKLFSKTYKTIKTATCTATPSISSITTPSTGKVTLGFSAVTGETGYTVYYSTSSTSGFKKYANYAANSKTGDVTGLTSGKTYYFKVRTYKTTDSGYVYSPWSAVKSIKVK